MSGYALSIGPDVLAARIALTEGLHLIRDTMTATIRSDGGLPHTRERPHTGDSPGVRQPSGPNTRQLDGRAAPAGRLSPEGRTEATPTGTIAIDTEPKPDTDGSGGPPPGYPDRPDRPDAADPATAVWLLVERAQAGDAEAFGLIYDRYFDTVFRFVYFRVGNRQLAEDLAADT
ncbi:MAG: polymerase subunit sigma-24, partial [Dactylosporangium sp.]|nr:polymerase subunit sigma-24 [Dactylosporangium sp.]